MTNNSIANDRNPINTSFLRTVEEQQRYEAMMRAVPMPSYLETPQGFSEVAVPVYDTCSKQRESKKDIAEVKNDFLEHIPEQNHVIASTVFNLMTVILSGVDLDFEKIMKTVPQDIRELTYFCALNTEI